MWPLHITGPEGEQLKVAYFFYVNLFIVSLRLAAAIEYTFFIIDHIKNESIYERLNKENIVMYIIRLG